MIINIFEHLQSTNVINANASPALSQRGVALAWRCLKVYQSVCNTVSQSAILVAANQTELSWIQLVQLLSAFTN